MNFETLTKEQFEYLLNQSRKLDKLHLDLMQAKRIGGQDNVKIEYVLTCIENELY